MRIEEGIAGEKDGGKEREERTEEREERREGRRVTEKGTEGTCVMCSLPSQPNCVVYGRLTVVSVCEQGKAGALKLRPSLRCLPLTDIPRP